MRGTTGRERALDIQWEHPLPRGRPQSFPSRRSHEFQLQAGRCGHGHEASELRGAVTNSKLNSSYKIFRMTKYYFNRKINLYPEPPKTTCPWYVTAPIAEHKSSAVQSGEGIVSPF